MSERATKISGRNFWTGFLAAIFDEHPETLAIYQTRKNAEKFFAIPEEDFLERLSFSRKYMYELHKRRHSRRGY